MKVLVVGQTPPPYGGNAIMIERLLKGSYRNAELLHVRMSFSKQMDEMGKLRIRKIFHLLRTIFQIILMRLKYDIEVLYYPISGPTTLPMLRDFAILCATRWMFKKTMFHFHAAGISKMLPGLPWYLSPFYRWGYFKPELAVQLSKFNPNDGAFLKAKIQRIVPNGLSDDSLLMEGRLKLRAGICRILYVGLVAKSKGILVLVDAIRILKEKGVAVRVIIVGEFESYGFRNEVMNVISTAGMESYFELKGVLTGADKHKQFFDADIFCFPTYVESESFGLVVVEAMQFGLPVVASRWQGVQSLVVEGETGFLTPVRDSQAISEKLQLLISDSELRERMGAMGRHRYLREFTLEKFHERMDSCFSEIGKLS